MIDIFLLFRNLYVIDQYVFGAASGLSNFELSFFDIATRFCIPPSPLHSFLPSLIADYNPSHKLLIQLRTFNKFFEKTMTYNVTLKVLWMLAPLRSPLINTLKTLAPLRVFIS